MRRGKRTGMRRARPRRVRPMSREIGSKLLKLAEEDNRPAKIMFALQTDPLKSEKKTFKIKGKRTRVFIYERKPVSATFRIFIDATVNGERYPYVAVNTAIKDQEETYFEGSSDTKLKKVYKKVNLDLRGEFANVAKIMKPGTFLFHNLLFGDKQKVKPKIEIYSERPRPRHLIGKAVGHEGAMKGYKEGTEPFYIRLEPSGSEGLVKVPLHSTDLVIFKTEPVFDESPEGKLLSLGVKLLKEGHICRPEITAGFLVDVCNLFILRIYYREGDFYSDPKFVPGAPHDESIKKISKKIIG